MKKVTVESLFDKYVNDFKKSPIKDVRETETGLDIKFEDVFYNKLVENDLINEVQDFINKMLKDYIKVLQQRSKKTSNV